MKGALRFAFGCAALIAFSSAPARVLAAPTTPKSSTTLVLQFKPGTTEDGLQRAKEAVAKRLNYLGVEKPLLTPVPPDRLHVQFPPMDRKRLDACRETLKKPGKIAFRMVHAESDILVAKLAADPTTLIDPAYELLPYEHERDGQRIKNKMVVAKKIDIAGDRVKDAAARFDDRGMWCIVIDFNTIGADDFTRVTGEMARDPRRLQFAIVMDGAVLSAAGLSEEARNQGGITGGGCVITGNFNETEARDVANALLHPLDDLVRIEESNPSTTPAKDGGVVPATAPSSR